MVASASPIVLSVLSHIYCSVLHEADVFVRSTWRDWLTSIIPGIMFILGSLTYLPFDEAIFNSMITVLNLTIYVYFFNTWTQYTSVEEDRINKPDRPIPAGITTPAGAKRRGIVLTALWFSFAIYRPDLIVETWILVNATITLAMNNLGRHWFVKNTICMTVMTWGLYSSPRKLMGAPLPNTSNHLVALAAWVGSVINAQDLRDVEGDKETGSWTLPMALGDDKARLLIAFLCMPLGYMTLWYNGMAQLAPWVLAGLHVLVSYRFMTMRNRTADHTSYMWICKTFCIMCGLSSLEAAKLISPDRPLEVAVSSLFSG
ncbi:UbiA prenyltransferase family-domain-containing protein [Aspergillus minisclerotigenes]|uniref:UbiA prenyltransferase family-domain-containing protein n=1 Tax=Aspergillus minisclerotigenes TaxID=656917 RepID=A0A5N6IRY7_9EURO|nr:UbiA prenyltransferase family-domain-containing protein [Aspergillus minisclerotigenes]